MVKISVVVTVLNEEGTISRLLDSLLSQTKPPDEIVVVDGGSSDNTFEILKRFQDKNPHCKVFQIPGSLSEGRNAAVSHASGEIIVQTDAGCVPEADWVEKITGPFSDDEVDVVAGYYKMEADNYLAKAAVPFHGVPRSQLDPRSYLPTGRSLAYRKEYFSSVGGYSADVSRGGEDIEFNSRLIQENANVIRMPSALVIWQVPSTLLGTLRRFAQYSHSDAQTGVWWHIGYKLGNHQAVAPAGAKVMSLSLLPIGVFSSFSLWLFLSSFIILSFWSIWRVRDVVTTFRSRMYVPLIQMTADAMLVMGYLYGVFLRSTEPSDKE